MTTSVVGSILLLVGGVTACVAKFNNQKAQALRDAPTILLEGGLKWNEEEASFADKPTYVKIVGNATVNGGAALYSDMGLL